MYLRMIHAHIHIQVLEGSSVKLPTIRTDGQGMVARNGGKNQGEKGKRKKIREETAFLCAKRVQKPWLVVTGTVFIFPYIGKFHHPK